MSDGLTCVGWGLVRGLLLPAPDISIQRTQTRQNRLTPLGPEAAAVFVIGWVDVSAYLRARSGASAASWALHLKAWPWWTDGRCGWSTVVGPCGYSVRSSVAKHSIIPRHEHTPRDTHVLRNSPLPTALLPRVLSMRRKKEKRTEVGMDRSLVAGSEGRALVGGAVEALAPRPLPAAPGDDTDCFCRCVRAKVGVRMRYNVCAAFICPYESL